MEIKNVSINTQINEIPKKSENKTVNQSPIENKIAGDKSAVSNKSIGSIPAMASVFASNPIDPEKLKLSSDEIVKDLEKAGTNTYAEKWEMSTPKIDKDGNVTYRIEGKVSDYINENAEPNLDYAASEWKGKLENGKIVNREPLHDIKLRSGGDNTVDGLNINNIRYGKQPDGSERIVFEIKSGLGEEYGQALTDVNKLGGYEVFQSINKDGTATLNISLNGIRAGGGGSDKLKGGKDSVFKDFGDGVEALMDDSSTNYRIQLKQPVNIEVKELVGQGPARIVIDFKKADK